MAASRHLVFSDTESFTIRSAVPENPMTELDIMSLSCIEPELCQFERFDKMAAVCHLGFCSLTYRATHDGALAVLYLVSCHISY